MAGARFGEKPPRDGLRSWFGSVVSVLGSAVFVTAVGFFCALVYPILKELRTERVGGQNGAEERILGFWSILVLAAVVGCICCIFSWILTYLDSQQSGAKFPSPPSLERFRHITDHGFNMSYGVAALNGLMALLTVIWSLS
uniref:ADP-ribosylation-like factor 6 interacting protein 6 n=1 Tax=Iconisemion striatum TaxID=60296 RepID=A0A1A7WYI2_9TELE